MKRSLDKAGLSGTPAARLAAVRGAGQLSRQVLRMLETPRRAAAGDDTGMAPTPAPSNNTMPVHSAPAWAALSHRFEICGLSIALWEHILAPLDESDISRFTRTCRALYSATLQLASPILIDAKSPLARKLGQASFHHLRALCALAWEPAGDAQSAARHKERYEQSLAQFAARFRFVEVQVDSGFETFTVQALLAGQRWQCLHIHLGAGADPAFIAALEQGLALQHRHGALELSLDDATALARVLPRQTSLYLTGLFLSGLDLGDVELLQPLLASDCFALKSLSIDGSEGEGGPDALFCWIRTCCPALQELMLWDPPEHADSLLATLAALPALTSLTLANGHFSARNLALGPLLQAAPRLERLNLSNVEFEAGCASACWEILIASPLQCLRWEECALITEEEADGADEDGWAGHEDFLNGLSLAPRLRTLEIGMPICRESTKAVLRAFAANGAARSVFFDRPFGLEDQQVRDQCAAYLQQLNARRIGLGMAALLIWVDTSQ